MKIKILLLIIFFFNCNTMKYYAINRGNDFLDIFTFGIEKGVYGIKILDLIYTKSENGYGIGFKNGNFGFYKLFDSTNPVYVKRNGKWRKHYFGESGYGKYYFELLGKFERNNEAEFNFIELEDGYLFGSRKEYFFKQSEIEYLHKKFYANKVFSSRLTFFEFSFGLYFGVRIGFSGIQFVDFIVGIFGFDPYKDDYDKSGFLPVLNYKYNDRRFAIKNKTITLVSDEELSEILAEIEKDIK